MSQEPVNPRREEFTLPCQHYDLQITRLPGGGYHAKISNGLHWAQGTSEESATRAVKRALSCCGDMFRKDLSLRLGGP